MLTEKAPTIHPSKLRGTKKVIGRRDVNFQERNGWGGAGNIPLRLDDAMDALWEKVKPMIVMMELFISNMPSLVGSLALAWASTGVDWFKVRNIGAETWQCGIKPLLVRSYFKYPSDLRP